MQKKSNLWIFCRLSFNGFSTVWLYDWLSTRHIIYARHCFACIYIKVANSGDIWCENSFILRNFWFIIFGFFLLFIDLSCTFIKKKMQITIWKNIEIFSFYELWEYTDLNYMISFDTKYWSKFCIYKCISLDYNIIFSNDHENCLIIFSSRNESSILINHLNPKKSKFHELSWCRAYSHSHNIL